MAQWSQVAELTEREQREQREQMADMESDARREFHTGMEFGVDCMKIDGRMKKRRMKLVFDCMLGRTNPDLDRKFESDPSHRKNRSPA